MEPNPPSKMTSSANSNRDPQPQRSRIASGKSMFGLLRQFGLIATYKGPPTEADGSLSQWNLKGFIKMRSRIFITTASIALAFGSLVVTANAQSGLRAPAVPAQILPSPDAGSVLNSAASVLGQGSGTTTSPSFASPSGSGTSSAPVFTAPSGSGTTSGPIVSGGPVVGESFPSSGCTSCGGGGGIVSGGVVSGGFPTGGVVSGGSSFYGPPRIIDNTPPCAGCNSTLGPMGIPSLLTHERHPVGRAFGRPLFRPWQGF